MSPALSHLICNCSGDNRMPAHAGHSPVCKAQRPETVACPRCHGRGIEHWHPHHDDSHTPCLCCYEARKVFSRSGARVGITTDANTNKRAPTGTELSWLENQFDDLEPRLGRER